MVEGHNGDWEDQTPTDGSQEQGGGNATHDSGEQPTMPLPPLNIDNSLRDLGSEHANENVNVDGHADGHADDYAGEGASADAGSGEPGAEQPTTRIPNPAVGDSGRQETEPLPTSSSIPGPLSTAQSSTAQSSTGPSAPGQSAGFAGPAVDSGQSPVAGQNAAGPYRPAPEYGAYGPVPVQTEQQQNEQNVGFNGTQNPVSGDANGAQGGRNPYFGSNDYGNPFANRNPYGAQQQGVPHGNGQMPGAPQPPQGQGYPQRNPFTGRPSEPSTAQRTVSPLLSAIVAAVVAAALCLGIGYAAITNGWISVPASTSIANIGSNSSSSGSAALKAGQSANWTAVSKAVSGSVVSIQTTISGGVAKGSGAIVDSAGYIVTNNHVISGATAIQVTLTDGQIYSAKLVGTDTTTDLAVIKMENAPSGLKAVTFADSDSLAVGESVMAIGNPLGYDDTATTGIVSALNRPVSVTDESQTEIVTNAVQIDAAINPGNSGGPTFNSAGQVVGINSSIATASSSSSSSSSESGSIGIGFAIPSNLVKRVSQEIIKDGSVKHVKLGVTIQSSTATADGVTRGGAKVVQVTSGSPADKAGLKSGDTIVAYDGYAVNNNYSVLGFVRAAALGDKAKLTVVRDSKAIEIDVTLDQQESTSTTSSGSGSGSSGNNNNNNNNNGNGLTDPFGLW